MKPGITMQVLTGNIMKQFENIDVDLIRVSVPYLVSTPHETGICGGGAQLEIEGN